MIYDKRFVAPARAYDARTSMETARQENQIKIPERRLKSTFVQILELTIFQRGCCLPPTAPTSKPASLWEAVSRCGSDSHQNKSLRWQIENG